MRLDEVKSHRWLTIHGRAATVLSLGSIYIELIITAAKSEEGISRKAFTIRNAEAVARKLGGEIEEDWFFAGDEYTGVPDLKAFEIAYPTFEEAQHALKILRRLARGRPSLVVNEVKLYQQNERTTRWFRRPL